MLNSLTTFQRNIESVREIGALHDFLVSTLRASLNFDDLLRFQIVYSVSAFDKLIHDIVRIGMLETFIGRRPPTPKYLNERLTMETFIALDTATMPPREVVFGQHLVTKFGTVSFQDPNKVADGLSYIWPEANKWRR